MRWLSFDTFMSTFATTAVFSILFTSAGIVGKGPMPIGSLIWMLCIGGVYIFYISLRIAYEKGRAR